MIFSINLTFYFYNNFPQKGEVGVSHSFREANSEVFIQRIFHTVQLVKK